MVRPHDTYYPVFRLPLPWVSLYIDVSLTMIFNSSQGLLLWCDDVTPFESVRDGTACSMPGLLSVLEI